MSRCFVSPNITSFFAPFTLALIASLVAGTARADTVSGTRASLGRAHALDPRVALPRPRRARRAPHRLQRRPAPRPGACSHRCCPEGAVATGLRTLGTLAGRPHWFAGELMEAEAAAAQVPRAHRHRRLLPEGPGAALLALAGAARAAGVPVPARRGEDDRIHAENSDGLRGRSHHLRLPAVGTEALVASAEARAGRCAGSALRGRAPLRADGSVARSTTRSTSRSIPRQAPGSAGGWRCAVRRPTGRWSRFELSCGAACLERAARGAVVRCDRRLALGRLRKSSAAALAAEPTSPTSPTPRSKCWSSIGSCIDATGASFRRLGRAQISRKTRDRAGERQRRRPRTFGSRSAARGDPGGTPRRIVLMTDGHTRSKLSPERLRAAVAKSGAIVHLGIVNAGHGTLARDDEHHWSAATRSSGGLVWKADAPSEPVSDDEREALRAVYEEWARPLRVDRLRFFSADLAARVRHAARASLSTRASTRAKPSRTFRRRTRAALARGRGRALGRAGPRDVLARPGKEEALGSARVRLAAPRRAQRGGDDAARDARRGRHPVTSYLAIEPGVRPSTEGLEGGEGMGGISSFGHGVGTGHGQWAAGSASAPFDRGLS